MYDARLILPREREAFHGLRLLVLRAAIVAVTGLTVDRSGYYVTEHLRIRRLHFMTLGSYNGAIPLIVERTLRQKVWRRAVALNWRSARRYVRDLTA